MVFAERLKGRVHPPVADDMLEGAEAIAKFLGKRWSERKVRYARDIGTLPIRKKKGMGLYAFKSELTAALWASDSLPTRPHPSRENGEDPDTAGERRKSNFALEDRCLAERVQVGEMGGNCHAST